MADNVQQAVPFFAVASMEASLRFYVDGLGCRVTKSWTPDGAMRWCWLELGGAALMLQESRPKPDPAAQRGIGVSICFQCRDAIALYREFKGRGLAPRVPFVGNAMWVTVIRDPDGYVLDFESPTDAPEESVWEEAGFPPAAAIP